LQSCRKFCSPVRMPCAWLVVAAHVAFQTPTVPCHSCTRASSPAMLDFGEVMTTGLSLATTAAAVRALKSRQEEVGSSSEPTLMDSIDWARATGAPAYVQPPEKDNSMSPEQQRRREAADRAAASMLGDVRVREKAAFRDAMRIGDVEEAAEHKAVLRDVAKAQLPDGIQVDEPEQPRKPDYKKWLDPNLLATWRR